MIVETPPEGPPQATTSLPGRLFNVFAVPGEVFDEVRDAKHVTANWVLPAVLAILLGWAGAWLVFSQPSVKQQLTEMTDKAIQKQIGKQNLSKEQADQARAVAEKYGDIGQKVTAAVIPVVWGFGCPFLWGFILWLVGTKALKGSFEYMKAVEIVGLGNMVGVLETVVKTLLIVVTGNLFAAPGLVLLVGEYNPQNPVHMVLAIFNIMTFWILAVRAVGLARLARCSFGKAAVWVFGIWAAYTSAFTGFGIAMQALMSKVGG